MTAHKRIALLVSCGLLLTTTAAWAELYNGSRWADTNLPVPYHINEAGAPGEFAPIVQGCIDQWNRPDGSYLRFVLDGIDNRTSNNYDGTNTFTWSATGEGMLDPLVPAITRVRKDAQGKLIECDTVLNGSEGIKWCISGVPQEDEYDLKSVILREIGRWVQLDFTTDAEYADSLMFDPLEMGVMKNILSPQDVDALCQAYPAAHIPDDYEDDDSFEDATLLVFDEVQSDHNIFPTSDFDYYYFTLAEDTSIRIVTSGSDPLGDTVLDLYNSDYELIGHIDDPENPPPGGLLYAIIEMPGLAAGTYYVSVYSAGNLSVVDPYSIVLTYAGVDAYERDDQPAFARRISPGQVQVRSLAPIGDLDWAYFVLDEPSRVVIRTDSTVYEYGDTVLYLYNYAFELIDYNDDNGVNYYSTIEVATLPAGIYYICVEVLGHYEEIPHYTLTLQQFPAIGDLFEPDDTPGDAKELIDGVAQAHSIDPVGDVDWVYIHLTQNAEMITVETTGIGLNDDTYMEMYDSSILTNPSALPIAVDDNSGHDGRFAKIERFTVAAGKYYFKVRQKNNDAMISAYQIVYTPIISYCDIYERDDTPEMAKVLVPGVPQQHCIQPLGDNDWMKFTLESSAAITLQLSAADLQMYLYRNTPTNLIDYTSTSTIEMPIAPKGLYYVRVRGMSNAVVVGAYTVALTVQPHATDAYEPDNTPLTGTTLTSGTPSANHSLSPLEDIDWYKINITQLSDIEVVISSGTKTTELYLYDSTVASAPDPNLVDEMAYSSGTGTNTLRHIELVPGTYYISVNEWGNNELLPSYQIVATRSDVTAFRASPPFISFSADWQYLPRPVMINVRHLTSTVAWSCVSDSPWITPSQTSGTVGPGQSQEVQLSFSIMSFTVGAYTGNVVFTAGSSISTVQVTMNITENPGLLSYDKTQFTFSATEGAISPATQQLVITNAGGGNAFTWELVPDQPCVTFEPSGGIIYRTTTTIPVTVRATVDGLLPGTHTVNLTLVGLENSPATQPATPVITFVVAADSVKPTPLDTTFTVVPQGIPGTDSITMTAVPTVDDQQAPVEYFFEFMGGDAGGASSGWQRGNNVFTLGGLVRGGYYTYRVKVRDISSNKNETNFSAKHTGYVAPVIPPAPEVGTPTVSSLRVKPLRGAENSPRVLLAIYNVTDNVYVNRFGEAVVQPVWRLQEEWGTVEVKNLLGDTSYTFKIVAMNGQGMQSGFSNGTTVYTIDNGPPQPVPYFTTLPTLSGFSEYEVTMTCSESLDNSPPVEYYFEYAGPEADGQSSGWQTSRSYTRSVSVPAGQYSYRVKARDSSSLLKAERYETAWSDVATIYRTAQTPATPLSVAGTNDTTIRFKFGTDSNSASADYAICVQWGTTTKYLDETWNLVTDPVWRKKADWTFPSTTYIEGKGLPTATYIDVSAKARNGAGAETAFSGVYGVTPIGTDASAPAPDPLKWEPLSTFNPHTSATTTSIKVKPVAVTDTSLRASLSYEFVNITDNKSTGWLQYASEPSSREYTFQTNKPTGAPALTACKQYQFRARAKDSVLIGGYTEILTVWTKCSQPLKPTMTTDGVLQRAWLNINDSNPAEARYAIQITNLTNMFLSSSGTIVGAENKAWLSKQEWPGVYLTDFDPNVVYNFKVIARNPSEMETPATAVLSSKIEFNPPTPNPPVVISAAMVGANVQVIAQTASDPAGVSYYFESVGGIFPASGWIRANTYAFTPAVTAIVSAFRVKYRDDLGNETGWSAPSSVAVPPAPCPPAIYRGNARVTTTPAGNRVFITIDRGTNHPLAEYAIRGINTTYYDGMWISVTGNPTSTAVWRTYEQWSYIVGVRMDSPTIRVWCRIPGDDSSSVLGLDAVFTTDGYPDTSAPTPNPMYFDTSVGTPFPVAKTPTSISLRATAATDDFTYVSYGFQKEGEDMVWVWQRNYTFENLTPATTYNFRVQARDCLPTPNTGTASVYRSAWTPAAVPGKPSVQPGSISFTLQINPANNPPSVKYAILDFEGTMYLSASKRFESDSPVWKTIAEWGTITVTGIEPLSWHEIIVIAQHPDSTQTDYSPSLVFAAMDTDDVPPTPNPIGIVGRAVATGSDSFFVECTEATDKTGPVQYQFALQGEGTNLASGWRTDRTWEPTGLVPGGKYNITVQARDSHPQQNTTGPSAPITVYLHPVQPDAPTVSNITQTGMKLTINRGLNSLETRFAIRESISGRYVNEFGALAPFVPEWRTMAQWGSLVNVTGLQAGATSYFCVVSRSWDEATSTFSAETQVNTPADVQVPTPAAPGIVGLSPRIIRLQLSPGTYDPATRFIIRCAGGKSGYVQSDGAITAVAAWRTLAEWASPVLVRTLNPNTSYQFDLRADFGGQLSEWSTQTNVLTNIDGDANSDNKVNVLDLILVRNSLNQSPLSGLNYRCDVNDDSKINVLDLILIRNRLNTFRP
ncbi:MAG TPA: pre-peptidase C-terminal domain-containing protein [Planctomycetota bacterium]|nr:pre-peptidase C-terminal domain-containing protein [Planctomycetota bacterium]